MATSLAHTADSSSREIPLLAILGLLVVAQIIAFWMLCNQQVANGHARNATMQQSQTASVYRLNDPSESVMKTRARRSEVGANTLNVSYVR